MVAERANAEGGVMFHDTNIGQVLSRIRCATADTRLPEDRSRLYAEKISSAGFTSKDLESVEDQIMTAFSKFPSISELIELLKAKAPHKSEELNGCSKCHKGIIVLWYQDGKGEWFSCSAKCNCKASVNFQSLICVSDTEYAELIRSGEYVKLWKGSHEYAPESFFESKRGKFALNIRGALCNP